MDSDAQMRQLLNEAQSALKTRLMDGAPADSATLMRSLFETGARSGLTERQICVTLLQPLLPLLRSN